ncbi:hypothetical protein TW81_11300 [Vibrio galatheae]|uniref:DUF218 domain-containing protein n=1 Tax=Vibrio galatheae TaxID=579748 RepID=A0A0F4NIM1_9VIBR|nr:YdcF family protein [Vibrio galatheae]KJY82794.1 hypothetical protein TW81_11300 [Vibrio galatheae]
MDIENVVLVLGKRLANNVLTSEGRTRVEALSKALDDRNLASSAVIFCGGMTGEQTQTEAQAMYDYFLHVHKGNKPRHIILEGKSTNTIENITNAAQELVSSKMCRQGQAVTVTFISNDYHLKRIFEIQTLMDEQGLLRTLKMQCAQSGLTLNISTSISDHIAEPYPHSSTAGQVFLLLDEITTYRVYLEGVKSNVFNRPLPQVREQPYKIACYALKELNHLITDADSLRALGIIKSAVDATAADVDYGQACEQLALLNDNLIKLNRRFDPEQQGYEDGI